MATPTPPERLRAVADGGACLSAAERTAFAFGELGSDDGGRTAAVSRHLLRCARCRAEVDAVAALRARLGLFGRGGDWESDVGAALTAQGGRVRSRRRAALAGVAAAAGIVAVLGVSLAALGDAPRTTDAGRSVAVVGNGPVSDGRPAADPASERAADPRTSPPSVGAASTDDPARSRLLAAQASDGRFSASSRVGGSRHDEATTGLAILALVGGGHGVPRDVAGARALAAAVRWLRSRQTGEGRFGTDAGPGAVRDHAIATAAILEVSAATGDAALRSVADRGVRVVARDEGQASPGSGEPDSLWTRDVLARARAIAAASASAGPPSLDRAILAPGWSVGGASETASASPYARAVAVVDTARRE